MYISKFRVTNYKSFWQPDAIELGPGFNIVTGQNSSGKTAFLEALTLSYTLQPHRSARTAAAPDAQLAPDSVVDLRLTVPRDELFGLLASINRPWFIPHPAPDCDLVRRVGRWDTPEGRPRIVQLALSADPLDFDIRLERGSALDRFQCARFPSFATYHAAQPESARPMCIEFRVSADGSISSPTSRPVDVHDELGPALGRVLRGHIYRFDAQRFNVGSCPAGDSPILKPQADNLAEVLSCLQANPEAFSHFSSLVTRVLPHVRRISVRPFSNQRVGVLVWTLDPATRRLDLARPLSECGTGVGQVLAILYAAVSAPRAQVILIDEPQSFLHPGAVRKLMGVLSDRSRHQYIISTHSPSVITSCEPVTVTVARLRDEETALEQVEPTKAKSLRACLSEIGAALSDVFGADNVLWVEGPTEEACFPLILRRVAGRSLMGTAVVGIRRVGDLEGRDAERAFEMLNTLSAGPSLVPPAVGVVLDSECRTDEQKTEMSRRRGQRVHFLPRRMYENYLLDADGIADVLNRLDVGRAAPLSAAEVERAIEPMRRDRGLLCGGTRDGDADQWEQHVHGAEVLSILFSHLTEARVSFDKVRDCFALTEWLAQKKPEALHEIADLLCSAIEGPADGNGPARDQV